MVAHSAISLFTASDALWWLKPRALNVGSSIVPMDIILIDSKLVSLSLNNLMRIFPNWLAITVVNVDMSSCTEFTIILISGLTLEQNNLLWKLKCGITNGCHSTLLLNSSAVQCTFGAMPRQLLLVLLSHTDAGTCGLFLHVSTSWRRFSVRCPICSTTSLSWGQNRTVIHANEN